MMWIHVAYPGGLAICGGGEMAEAKGLRRKRRVVKGEVIAEKAESGDILVEV